MRIKFKLKYYLSTKNYIILTIKLSNIINQQKIYILIRVYINPLSTIDVDYHVFLPISYTAEIIKTSLGY